MVEARIGYQTIVQSSTPRELADRVFRLCQDGRAFEAAQLLNDERDPDSLFARGLVAYWAASAGNAEHETAKNILSEAERLFSEDGSLDRAALCRVYVGLCFSRQGQPDEAALMINESVLDASEPTTRLVVYLSLAVIDLERKCWRAALTWLRTITPIVDSQPILSLRGRFYHHRALAYRQGAVERGTDYTDRALTDYEAALYYYEQSGNRGFEGRILNNIAYLYLTKGCYDEAHRNVDLAITLQQRLNDRAELAQATDTRAQILLAEGRWAHARRSADHAIALLRMSDQKIWLPDFLATRARATARLGLVKRALRDFNEAIALAETLDNKDALVRVHLALIDELIGRIPLSELIGSYRHVHEMAGRQETGPALKLLEQTTEAFAANFADLEKTERQQESEIIKRALVQAKGSLAKAARTVNMPRTTLRSRILTHHPELRSYLRPPQRRGKNFFQK